MTSDLHSQFRAIAVEQGYCTAVQWEEAVQVFKKVQGMGLKEDLANILVKKNILTPDQVRRVKEQLGPEPAKTSTHIAGYEILQKIGHGGMGAVFKARQISLDRIVALKILSPKLADDKDFAERFLKEARAVAKLSHPNIIVGIDVGKAGKYYYFAMEMVEGKTTLQLLRESGAFREERAIRIAIAVAEALAHAHRHGFVHRDIKPDNIMLTSRGEEVKLLDLGLAKKTDSDAGMTQTGSAVGTPHYISPEQARGAQDVDIRSDIYGLGATLYHLTTGRTLFEGDNTSGIMAKQLIDQGPNARKLRPELSEPFCLLLEKMLAKERGDRFQTPEELIANLELVLNKQPLRKPLAPSARSSMTRAPRSATRASVRGGTSSALVAVNASGEIREPREPREARNPFPAGHISTGPHRPVRAGLSTGALLGILGGGVTLILAVVLISGQAGGPAAGRPGTEPPKTEALPREPVAVLPAVEPKAAGVPAQPQVARMEFPGPELAEVSWEPLKQARAFRAQHPEQVEEQLKRFDAALEGAPEPVKIQIRQERMRLEREIDATTERLIEERRKLALEQMGQGAFGKALESVDPARLGSLSLGPRNKVKLEQLRGELEEQIRQRLEAEARPVWEKEFAAAQQDRERLKRLLEQGRSLQERFPGGASRALIEKAMGEVTRRIREIAWSEGKAFRSALLQTRSSVTTQCDLTKALAQLRAKAPAGVAPEDWTLLLRDLEALQGLWSKAKARLQREAGAKTPMQFSLRGKTIAGELSTFSNPQEQDAALHVRTDKKQEPLPFPLADLDPDSLLRLGEWKPETADFAYHLGIDHFWRRRFEDARRILAPLLKEATHAAAAQRHLDWIEDLEREAYELVATASQLVQSSTKPEASDQDRKSAAGRVEELLKVLAANYQDTEVYRVLPQQAK